MEWTIGWWQISIQRVYPTPTQLAQSYNRAAIRWHQLLQLLGYRFAYRKLWQMLKTTHILPVEKDNFTLCDCGIGTAAFSLAFAQAINPKVHIAGVDLSAEMLNQAHQHLAQANVSHQLYQSNVIALPFAEQSLDGVISAHMLEHLPDPAQGLQEMVRVLRPGAPLVLVVTRSGLPGSLIQWNWGNRCFNQAELSTLMDKVGLSHVKFFPFPIGLARLTSIACIGLRKT